MDMIGKVRRMRLRDQLFLSEIAKRTGLSRKTVKKLLRAPSDVASKYERVKLDGKLTASEPALHQALTTDSHRPKQGRPAAVPCCPDTGAGLLRRLQRRHRLHPALAGGVGS